MDRDQMLDLVPLYALDALEDAELQEFEVHLHTCQECSSELAIHQALTAALIPDEPAPTGVWPRIANRLSETGPSLPVVPLAEKRSARESPLRWLASVAALAALLLGALAIFQAVEIGRLNGPEAVLAAAEAAAGEPGAIVADLDSVARVVLTADGEGFLLPADLQTLGEERTYQLWVLTPDREAISAGVLGNEPRPVRFTWAGEVAGFALTREVAGGVASTAGDLVAAVEF